MRKSLIYLKAREKKSTRVNDRMGIHVNLAENRLMSEQMMNKEVLDLDRIRVSEKK